MQPTQNTAGPAQPAGRRWHGDPDTDAHRRYIDLRDAGYTGPIDHAGHPVLSSDPEQVPPATAATTLRLAARYLSRHGWTQEAYYHSRNRNPLTPAACMGGALLMVIYGHPLVEPPAPPEDMDEAEALAKVVAYECTKGVLDDYLIDRHDLGTFTYNDVTGRTAVQVITSLLAAADECDRLERLAAW